MSYLMCPNCTLPIGNGATNCGKCGYNVYSIYSDISLRYNLCSYAFRILLGGQLLHTKCGTMAIGGSRCNSVAAEILASSLALNYIPKKKLVLLYTDLGKYIHSVLTPKDTHSSNIRRARHKLTNAIRRHKLVKIQEVDRESEHYIWCHDTSRAMNRQCVSDELAEKHRLAS